jgi:adenine-specific DNA methylase
MNSEKSAPRYFMHKYWGKKPASGISPLVDRYTNPGDTIIDPFSGYGVFCCEAYLKNRNVIVNDLNPIANFIAKNLFSKEVNISDVKKIWGKIKNELSSFVTEWYKITIDGIAYNPISVLRNKDGMPLQFTFKDGRKTTVKDIPEGIAKEFCEYERTYKIEDWYPSVTLIENSRISARPNMKVEDLFTKRTLACHAKLLSLIEKYAIGANKDLFLIAFTANLANCSKLVPPIKTRGTLAQGAWMTGFYIGETYIENNVLHYYENRIKKAIKGKENFLDMLLGDLMTERIHSTYKITNYDAKNLLIPDNSVDYVFTDPPYGDSVPYFEQSVIWNSWLKLSPNYKEEIVISDSNQRHKDITSFENDINAAFSEIRRILKDNKHFSLTFHSLSGLEWKAVSNACVFNNFNVVNYEWLEQKTYPPRQLNRIKSIKGDVLVTFRKNPAPVHLQICDEQQFTNIVKEFIARTIQNGTTDTNGIMMAIMEWILRNMIIVGDVDVFDVLNTNFHIGEDGIWSIN